MLIAQCDAVALLRPTIMLRCRADKAPAPHRQRSIELSEAINAADIPPFPFAVHADLVMNIGTFTTHG